jgi:dTDP-glucose pyrophosphorylase
LVIAPSASIREALEMITRNGRQAVAVAGADGRLAGLLTDGDVRRALLRGLTVDAPVARAMNPSPTTAPVTIDRAEALALMRGRSLHHLPLVESDGRLADVLYLDDLLATPRLPNRAVIMAGGAGRRLRPLTEDVPKPLLRAGGKPLLEILVERLREAGVADFVITVHHKSEMIEDHFGDGARWGVRIAYVREPEPLGTAGALTLVEEPLAHHPIFLVNGDILTKCDFRGMLDFHERIGAEMTVGTVAHEVELQYGVVEADGDRLVRVAEKPRLNFLINGGVYVLDPGVVGRVPRGQYFDATDLIRLLLAAGRPVAAFSIRDYWLDVGRYDDFRKAERDVAEGLLD